MKKTITILLFALLLAASAFGQTMLVNTSLSAAVTDGGKQTVVVASATGISAPAPNTGNTYGLATSEAQSYIFVDRELMQVKGVSSTTLTVIRGVAGTSGAPHAASAIVFVIPAAAVASFAGTGYSGSPQGPSVPQGSCTRSNELYLPRIHFASGVISDCLGGQWLQGDASQSTRVVFNTATVGGFRFPDPGGTALTSLETAGTAPGANTEEYCTEIDLPFSTLMTGLGVLNGTTATTDNHLVILRDASGKVLATSALAGALASGASVYQKFNFLSKYYAVGPARYFGCVQTNGTTATFRHSITAVNDNILAGKLTSQAFGTVVDAAMPSTYTTALGPYFLVY